MAFVLLVFTIGALNVVLGYAAAVYLGFGPPRLADTWRLLGPARRIGKTSDARGRMTEKPVPEPPPKQQGVSPAVALSPAVPEEAADLLLKPEPLDVDAFRRFVAMSASSLTDFSTRLKKSSWGDNQRTAWAFVAELQGICNPYLEKLRQATQQLCDKVGDEVQDLVLGQLAQLETTLSNLQYMDFDSGASAAIGRLSQETDSTLSGARKLQHALHPPPGTADQEASEGSPQALQVEPAVPG